LNKLKAAGMALVATGAITTDQWILILSIIVTVAGMIQSYLESRKK